ncbi:MAG: hypothetical protein HKO65_00250 [Gemmatimonadetes bacterium]|nr:hypothetical protein [Gemmatimonadota bacterium]
MDRFTRQTKRIALLTYLSGSRPPGATRRTELLTVFWPESSPSRGRNVLRQTLHAIRRELGPEVILGNGSEDLRINHDHLTCDASFFEGAISEGRAETALSWYEGDFGNGFDLPDCPAFGDWVDLRRQALREMAANAARDLAHQAEGMSKSEEALYWWRRALLHRPFDEAIIRRIGSLLAWEGNQCEAMAEMNSFTERMIAHLGVEPSAHTLARMNAISRGQMANINRWVGDRRQPWVRRSERHRKRSADHRVI